MQMWRIREISELFYKSCNLIGQFENLVII